MQYGFLPVRNSSLLTSQHIITLKASDINTSTSENNKDGKLPSTSQYDDYIYIGMVVSHATKDIKNMSTPATQTTCPRNLYKKNSII